MDTAANAEKTENILVFILRDKTAEKLCLDCFLCLFLCLFQKPRTGDYEGGGG